MIKRSRLWMVAAGYGMFLAVASLVMIVTSKGVNTTTVLGAVGASLVMLTFLIKEATEMIVYEINVDVTNNEKKE